MHIHRPFEAIGRIVDFCGFQLSDEMPRRAVDRSRFDYMKSREPKFAVAPSMYARLGVQRPEPLLRIGRSDGWQARLIRTQLDDFEGILVNDPPVQRALTSEDEHRGDHGDDHRE